MARVSIYVPDDLKAQMDAVSEINWSDVARPAFLMALAKYQHRKEPTMESTIERLRASKAQSAKRDEIAGKADGRAWAANRADYDELRRVAAIEFFHGTEFLDALYEAVDPEKKLSEREFKDKLFCDAYADISQEYAAAFIEGAGDLYEEIADEL